MRNYLRDPRILPATVARPAFQHAFGDDAPQWTEGRLRPRPCRTAAEAEDDLHRLIHRLRHGGRTDPAALRLANRLEEDPRTPSAASPVFARAFQRAFATWLDELLDPPAEFSIVSAVHCSVGASEGRLGEQPFERLHRRLQEALHASGVTWAVGGFDLSANEHERATLRPHYRPQAWCFVRTREIRGGQHVFREFFPRNELVPRPIRITRWDGDLAAVAYAFKPNFWRRITIEQTRADNAGARTRNTRLRPLRVGQSIEIALALDAAGPMSRLFLHGVDLVLDRNGCVVVNTTTTP